MVRALVRHVRSLDKELGVSVPLRIHTDEAAAVAYVLAHASVERTWAVLSFRALSAHHVDYAIRLNFTSLPATTFLTTPLPVGLLRHYQRCTHPRLLAQATSSPRT
jgi:hypothetical protein